jgi:hypothetical protein
VAGYLLVADISLQRHAEFSKELPSPLYMYLSVGFTTALLEFITWVDILIVKLHQSLSLPSLAFNKITVTQIAALLVYS